MRVASKSQKRQGIDSALEPPERDNMAETLTLTPVRLILDS